MNRSRFAAAYVTVALALVAAPHISVAVEAGATYRVVFPQVTVDAKLNQAVEEINFTVACGHIKAVTHIPTLWNVEIRRAVSEVEEFHASAGLGSARLSNLAHWSNSVTIEVTDPHCLDLLGSVMVGGEKYFELPLTKANLHKVATKR